MGSFRRSTSFVQREGLGQEGRASPRSSLLLKPSYSRGPLNLWGKSVDLLMVLQGLSRSGERLRSKGSLFLRQLFFLVAVFFVIGVLVGFTPFMAMDMSTNLSVKRQNFSYKGDLAAGNAQVKSRSVREKAPFKNNFSKAAVASGYMKDGLDIPYPQSPVQDSKLVPRKLLMIVTPTYARPFQAYYLNRLAHTLRLVPPPLLWIVVEMTAQSAETESVLRDTGLMYRHLVCNQNITTVKDKGVHQRNTALSHIEKYQLDGIVFFADDDRVYSADLFDHMRKIRRFGTWPVAILAESKNKVWMEGPVCNGTQVTGWHTSERSKMSRRFHANISGFAFNSTILWDPKRWHRPTPEPIRQSDTVRDGFQVTAFIEQLVADESQMEGFPGDCSRIMVWHLHVEAPDLAYPNGWLMQKNLEVVAPLK